MTCFADDTSPFPIGIQLDLCMVIRVSGGCLYSHLISLTISREETSGTGKGGTFYTGEEVILRVAAALEKAISIFCNSG
jgi:hypothetical protein